MIRDTRYGIRDQASLPAAAGLCPTRARCGTGRSYAKTGGTGRSYAKPGETGRSAAKTGGTVILLIVSFLLTSCGEQAEVTRYSENKAPVATETADQSTETASGHQHHGNAPYHWSKPAGWKSVPASGMRMASFSVPLDDETAD